MYVKNLVNQVKYAVDQQGVAGRSLVNQVKYAIDQQGVVGRSLVNQVKYAVEQQGVVGRRFLLKNIITKKIRILRVKENEKGNFLHTKKMLIQ
jgi:hypothetical protein